MRRTVSLEELARLTRQPVDRLRQWCATGLLAADRVDGAWALPEDELPAAHALSAVGPRLAASALPDGAHLIVVAFRDHRAARRALEAIRSRTGVRPCDVELAPLSIDGMPRVLVAGRIPAEQTARIETIVVDCGGQIIDGTEGLGVGLAAGVDDDAVFEGFGA
jgi:hypothetical protein